MPPDHYNTLPTYNITKTYIKTKTRFHRETRKLSKLLKLDNKVECYAEVHAFIALQNNKENFKQNIKCKLINLAKGEIGNRTSQ